MEKGSNISTLINGKYSWINKLPLHKLKPLIDPEIPNDEADFLAGLKTRPLNRMPSIKYEPEFKNPTNIDDINQVFIPDKEKTFYEKGIEDTKREKMLGLLGYGIQGVSALRDLAENVSQDYSQPPNDVYNKRIEYKPVDIEPYLNKMKESEAGYLKYLKETGNGNLIPSLMSYGSQKNELAAKMTEANNQKEIAIAGANAQSDLQTMQLNQQLRSDYNKQKFAEMQYRDNAIRSNKSAIFGSIAGAISTGAGATTKELQLDLYKERLAAGDIEGARAIAYQMSDLEDPYVTKSKTQNKKS